MSYNETSLARLASPFRPTQFPRVSFGKGTACELRGNAIHSETRRRRVKGQTLHGDLSEDPKWATVSIPRRDDGPSASGLPCDAASRQLCCVVNFEE